MINQRRFSLAAIFLGTTGVALALAFLPHPFVAYYVLLAFFFCAAVLYRVGPVEARTFWRWFAFSGWLYVFAGVSLLEAIESTAFVIAAQTWLEDSGLFPRDWRREDYLISAHSLVAMTVATSGGVLIPRLRRAHLAQQTSNQPSSACDMFPKSKP